MIVNGQCFTPGFSDRNYEYLDTYAPFFIENGGDLPSHLPQDIQIKVKDLVSRAAAALGVTNGTVKGDIVVHNGEPYVEGFVRLDLPKLLREEGFEQIEEREVPKPSGHAGSALAREVIARPRKQ